MSASARRKLAAIVFVDIAGYTDKTNRDEAGTLDVRGRIERLVKSSTLGHNGRIVKGLGDGFMLEFTSAVEAVSAALDIQDQMDHLNKDLELADPIMLRIGVHVGDVVEENEDLYGNAVNIASRVLSMAQPGGICITREVYVQIRPILKLQCAPVSGNPTDRLPEKVEVFAVLGEEGEFQAAAPSKKRANPIVVASLCLGALAIAIAGYMTIQPGTSAKASEQVHRILLPDWVTPGEWFDLDSGERGKSLAVYFGNRKAESQLVGGKLRVRTPSDLPTASTTISVFEDGSARPLLNQQTEVIRINSLAMNSAPATRDPIGQTGGPSVDVRSLPISEETPAASPAKSSSKPATNVAPNNDPPAPPAPGSDAKRSPTPPGNVPTVYKMPPIPEMKGYEALVTGIGANDFKFETMPPAELEKLNGTMGKAFRTVSLAQTGRSEKAKEEIQKIRVLLKDAKPEVAMECEAILKTAEAFLAEPGRPHQQRIVRVGPGHPNAKWAEAFAFSMNKGTRTLPGLMMIDRQIEAGKLDEARRAIGLMRERKDLTPAEKNALDKLESRVGAKSPATAPTSAGGE